MIKEREKGVISAGSLSETERIELIEEYLITDCSKVEIWNRYTGQKEEHGQIIKWMRMYGYVPINTKPIERPRMLHLPFEKTPSMDFEKASRAQLEQRIKDLENRLESTKIKAEGYELMIEIAEKELKIPIKKKLGTK